MTNNFTTLRRITKGIFIFIMIALFIITFFITKLNANLIWCIIAFGVFLLCLPDTLNKQKSGIIMSIITALICIYNLYLYLF